jgi:hypothetical protein
LRSTSDGSLLCADRTADTSFSPPMIILSSVCGTSIILLSIRKVNTLQLHAYKGEMIYMFSGSMVLTAHTDATIP